VQHALQQLTYIQDVDQETCSDDKCEVISYQVLHTTERACTQGSLAKTVLLPRVQKILVVRRQSQNPYEVGKPLSPLQLVERPTTGTMERSGKSDGLDSRQIHTCRYL
jgi:hypothetical protein